MRHDAGQALVVAVLLLSMAALAVSLLARSHDELLATVRTQRAGEAAVAAAGAAVADLHAERVRALARDLDEAETRQFASEEAVVAAARAAAVELARAHGRASPSVVEVRGFGVEVEVRVVLSGREHIALLDPSR